MTVDEHAVPLSDASVGFRALRNGKTMKWNEAQIGI